KKKLWQATQPLPPAVVASTTVIEPGATQPTPALDSTQVATPETPVVADNTVLADTKIPDDKIVTQVIEDVTTPTAAPTSTTSTTSTVAPTATTVAPTSTTSTTIPQTYQVGDTGPGGGRVFYVAPTQQSWGRYLEAAPTDYQVNGSRARVAWGCNSTSTGAAGLEIGTGKANTATILTKCTTVGIAADVANKYSTSTAGAGQWFLPSKDELNELCKIYSNGRTDTTAYASFQNGCTGNTSPTGGFAADFYWSSSENYALYAWGQYFSYGGQSYYDKGNATYVRPVRAF
ncbi:MAG: DUF1566 domain-containing protein, partial [Actinobacteria bacterium]|nr:DUF1566 domain-containing protein [Actinomycetota bacterium]